MVELRMIILDNIFWSLQIN